MKELRFDLSEAKSIRRIRQRTESWSPLADGQIISQGTLRPIVCHGGYDVEGIKRAVIWANRGRFTGSFELIDVTTNKQPPGEAAVVYTGRLKEAGFHIWGGNNYIADFSDFKREGLYCLRLKVKETIEVADSYVFRIGKSLYMDLAKKAAKWFYCVGAKETLETAIQGARKRSRIVVVGVVGGRPRLSVGLLQDRELEMVGTLMCVRDDFLTTVELMDLGKVTPTEMITARFKFRNLPEAYREADEKRGRNLKVMVEF